MTPSSQAREIVRAVSGPLLLILTGTLFWVDYAGSYRVGQTWPVLLIAFGLSKVFEHLASSPNRPRPPL